MIIDVLINRIIETKNPCIIGLDPDWDYIPQCYKFDNISETDCILQWNKDIIDAIADYIPAIKPQIAFYEKYGADGFKIFEQTVKYAQSKALIVIDDSKRNDIGNVSKSYVYGHLDKNGPINADFLTVSPFLGHEGLDPFIVHAITEDKGLFILVKTSNSSANEIQNAICMDGYSVSEHLGKYIYEIAKNNVGDYGYSAIGAVVGATYPEDAKRLRGIIRNSFFLVPGYGAQGGDFSSVMNCFNEDGLGALVSSSRGILYAYQEQYKNKTYAKNQYLDSVKFAAKQMRDNIYESLKQKCRSMRY